MVIRLKKIAIIVAVASVYVFGISFLVKNAVTVDDEGAKPVVTSCDQGGDARMAVKNDDTGDEDSNFYNVFGNTVATMGVAKGNELVMTEANGKDKEITIFAKPNDENIRFSYALCFGAPNVKVLPKLKTYMNGDNVEFDKETGASSISDFWLQNFFQVAVGKKGSLSEQSEALFGRATGLLGNKIFVSNKEIREGTMQINSGIGEEVNKKVKFYETTFYASGMPDQAVISEQAEYFDVNPARREVLFASPDNKEGSEQVDVKNYIGKTLSQTLVYSYIAFWPSKLCNDAGQCVGPFGSNNVSEGEYVEGVGWNSTLDDYNNAYDAYWAGYKNIPSDAINIGLGQMNQTYDVYKTASVVVPYNFDTELTSEVIGAETNPKGIVFPGDKIGLNAEINILPRYNPLTGGNYATATPANTKVETIELLIREDVNPDDSLGENLTVQKVLNGENLPIFNGSRICKQYENYLGDKLGECKSNIVIGNDNSLEGTGLRKVGNANSNPEGEDGYLNTNAKDRPAEKISRIVPDAEAGYKYCIAIGINHGDSHNAPGQELSEDPKDSNYAANEYSVRAGLNGSAKLSWKVSKFSCRTIAKEPNFQVWNGGVYSGGDLTSSITEKSVNTKLSLNFVEIEGDSDELKKLAKKNEKKYAYDNSYFGSWAEYFVVSKGSIAGFASASALGYTSPYTYYVKNDRGEEEMKVGYFGATGLKAKEFANNFCTLSHLTIANVKCSTDGEAGRYASGDADETFLESFEERILNYYTNGDTTGVSVGGGDIGDGNSSLTYVKQNGADYLKVNGSATIDTLISQESGTRVIEVLGDLTIKNNICIAGNNELCEGNLDGWKNEYDQNTNNLSLANDNNKSFNGGNLANLPQVIIIADNITIDSRVSQIDAWLITTSENGYIDTCGEFRSGTTGADECWKTLKINGPVIATQLRLNRTGGAWPGYAGDVGNQAYDVLREKMAEYINDEEHRKDYKDEAEDHCKNSLTKDSCIKKYIDKKLKNEFLNSISEDKEDPKRKAYENAANFYAGKGGNIQSVSVNNAISRDLTCDGSITPAEIFDLNPIVYYWALAELQKSNQAIVTYAQEFAPRY